MAGVSTAATFRGVLAAVTPLLLAAACGGETAAPENAPAASAIIGDPAAAGRVLFRDCAVCHPARAGEPARIGPNLYGVVGRRAGAAPDFAYSQAFQRLDLVWDAAALDSYLAAPQAFARGNRMAYPGEPDAARRAAIIAFLETLAPAE